MLWFCWRHKRTQRPPRGARAGELVEASEYHGLPHIARFILMGVYTGSQSSPIFKASIYAASDRAFLDLDSGLFYRLPEDVDEANNKRSPIVRIPQRLLAHLRRWRDKGIIAQYVVEWHGEPINSVKVGWATVLEGAGLDGRGIVPHTLRHTCVTWLLQDGVSTWDVAGFVGMSEEMVRRVYGHHHPDFQQRAAEAFHGNRRRHGTTTVQEHREQKAISGRRRHGKA